MNMKKWADLHFSFPHVRSWKLSPHPKNKLNRLKILTILYKRGEDTRKATAPRLETETNECRVSWLTRVELTGRKCGINQCWNRETWKVINNLLEAQWGQESRINDLPELKATGLDHLMVNSTPHLRNCAYSL